MLPPARFESDVAPEALTVVPANVTSFFDETFTVPPRSPLCVPETWNALPLAVTPPPVEMTVMVPALRLSVVPGFELTE